ncbi:SMI1/KNR4 family protein [Planctomyces sp. SH-PL62]|uniref:SMI1/KNR4 family protein n=1 Tax=Planctomyces sp. SH-PL62 TaxID=1636152 RepID=UPI0009EEDBB8|nr:SMI1/KNR4 family protein [Planctomyces sp. SH-PL62]
MDIKDLRNEISRIADAEFVGGVPADAITSAEADLQVSFPPSYRAFLREFGAGHVSSEDIFGLGGPQHSDVVWLAKELRSRTTTRFPRHLVPIRNDGFGNYDCIDTSTVLPNGECPIVEFVHGWDGGDNRKLSEDFFHWVMDIIKMVREIEA